MSLVKPPRPSVLEAPYHIPNHTPPGPILIAPRLSSNRGGGIADIINGVADLARNAADIDAIRDMERLSREDDSAKAIQQIKALYKALSPEIQAIYKTAKTRSWSKRRRPKKPPRTVDRERLDWSRRITPPQRSDTTVVSHPFARTSAPYAAAPSPAPFEGVTCAVVRHGLAKTSAACRLGHCSPSSWHIRCF